MHYLASFLNWFVAAWGTFWRWLESTATGWQALAAIIAVIIAILAMGTWIIRTKRRRKSETMRRHQQESMPVLTVGYDVFPDAMPLLLGIRLGVFKKPPFKIDVISKRFDWNEIFKPLERRQVDVIFGNKDECEKLTKDKHVRAFNYCGDLTDYYGFAIMVRRTGYLQPFVVGTNDQQMQRHEKLRQTIRQLNGKKVFASGNTDHYYNLVDCLSWAERNGEQNSVNIVHEGSPWDGLRLFLQEEVEAYVGGISQRLIAENDGAVPLVRQEDLADAEISPGKPLPLFEQNGFVVLKDRAATLEDDVRKLVQGWSYIVKQLDEKNPLFVKGFLEVFNESTRGEMRSLGLSKVQTFGGEDFKRLWQQWIRMHQVD